MSIGKRVSNAFKSLIEDDNEGAMYQICTAIEATAKLEFGAGGRRSYKDFLQQNFDIISVVGTGVFIGNLRMQYSHPDLTSAPDGVYSFQEIIYHAVRCGLCHDGALPENITFSRGEWGCDGKGGVLVPEGMIAGLVVAVVMSPANSNERCTEDYWVECKRTKFKVNDWWGKRLDFRNELLQP